MPYWIDAAGTIVGDTQPYIDADGTTYTAQWPKDEIPELKQVVETPRPDDAVAAYTIDGEARGGVYVTGHPGWHVEEIAGVPTQVWDVVARPAMSEAEAAAVAARNARSAAQAALDKSDLTVLRCVERGVPVPEAWATYRAALRAIVQTGVGARPAQPAYPEGT